MTARPCLRAALIGAALAATFGLAPAAQAASAGQRELVVRTVPPLPHVRFTLDGASFSSNAAGIARIAATSGRAHRLTVVDPGRIENGVRATFSRWDDDAFQPTRTVDLSKTTELQVGFEVAYLVRFSFADLHGHAVSATRVRSVTLSSTLGSRVHFTPGHALWLPGGRVARRLDGLEQTRIRYAVETVVVDGSNVVHHAQQRFYPADTHSFRSTLLLYSARITARDVLFHRPAGTALVLAYPNGHKTRLPLDASGVYLPALARGTYGLRAVAHGFSPAVPLSVSKNQVIALRVVTVLDISVVLGLAVLGTAVLVLARRPELRVRLRALCRKRAWLAAATMAVVSFGASSLTRPAAAAVISPAATPTPVLAYYYIWYDHRSWRRAKIDYPLLGRYSSDDVAVLRTHVAWAQWAGLDGFLVSWKSTPTLDRRLAKLVRVADAAHFKLALVYEGLDFQRRPLPVRRIRADLEAFAARWRRDPAFDLFGRPVVVWSGTWKFTPAAVAAVTSAVRPELSVLASERSVAGFERLRTAVDGDAYYWSSVDPAKDRAAGQKLEEMAAAVHRTGGLWIPPVAPGFDARLIGGHRIVARREGETLRNELDAAQQSSPDALGLISWNEFSENSEVEPSVKFGRSTLDTLRDLLRVGVTASGDFDSSDAPATNIGYGVPLLVGIGLIVAAGAGAVVWRREVRRVASRA
jgi:hypothetical protein